MTLLNAGYWQTTYWAENYWTPSYWQKFGVALWTLLLNAGYWFTTYFPSSFWNPLYWQKYGFVPPPTTVPATIGPRRRRPRRIHVIPRNLLIIAKEYLEMKVKQHD